MAWLRPRRYLLVFLVACLGLYFLPSVQLPAILKDAEGLSRANLVSLLKSSPKQPVDEIHGLIHLVTGDTINDHVLTAHDPSNPLDMQVYAPGTEDLNWSIACKSIDDRFPIVVFSKTYCPFSKKAKALLESYKLEPSPKVIEVDLRSDMHQLKVLLTRLTQHSTFPNILIRGKSIGGFDDLHKLHEKRTLHKLFVDAGVRVGAANI